MAQHLQTTSWQDLTIYTTHNCPPITNPNHTYPPVNAEISKSTRIRMPCAMATASETLVPGTICSDRPSLRLTDLPTEIVEQICSYGGDENYPALRQVRQTCPKLNAKTLHLFATVSFRNLDVITLEPSLSRLFEISRHPYFGRKVRRLTIGAVMASLCSADPRSFMLANEDKLRDGQFAYLLSQALTGLPNVDTIELTSDTFFDGNYLGRQTLLSHWDIELDCAFPKDCHRLVGMMLQVLAFKQTNVADFRIADTGNLTPLSILCSMNNMPCEDLRVDSIQSLSIKLSDKDDDYYIHDEFGGYEGDAYELGPLDPWNADPGHAPISHTCHHGHQALSTYNERGKEFAAVGSFFRHFPNLRDLYLVMETELFTTSRLRSHLASSIEDLVIQGAYFDLKTTHMIDQCLKNLPKLKRFSLRDTGFKDIESCQVVLKVVQRGHYQRRWDQFDMTNTWVRDFGEDTRSHLCFGSKCRPTSTQQATCVQWEMKPDDEYGIYEARDSLKDITSWIRSVHVRPVTPTGAGYDLSQPFAALFNAMSHGFSMSEVHIIAD